MRPHIAETFSYKITTDAFAMKLVQGACFVTSLLVLAASFWKLMRLDLTEIQLYCGVLLSLTTPLLFVVIGLLIPMSAATKNAS